MRHDDGQREPDVDVRWSRQIAAARARLDVVVASVASDRRVANGIRKALRRIGRRPGQLRALRVHSPVADDGDITAALDASRYLIAVLSPAAAASDHLDGELAHWLQRHQLDRLLF